MTTKKVNVFLRNTLIQTGDIVIKKWFWDLDLNETEEQRQKGTTFYKVEISVGIAKLVPFDWSDESYIVYDEYSAEDTSNDPIFDWHIDAFIYEGSCQNDIGGSMDEHFELTIYSQISK